MIYAKVNYTKVLSLDYFCFNIPVYKFYYYSKLTYIASIKVKLINENILSYCYCFGNLKTDIEAIDGGYEKETYSTHGNKQQHLLETLSTFGESQQLSSDGNGQLETLSAHGGDQQQPLATVHEDDTITDFKLSDEKIKGTAAMFGDHCYEI